MKKINFILVTAVGLMLSNTAAAVNYYTYDGITYVTNDDGYKFSDPDEDIVAKVESCGDLVIDITSDIQDVTACFDLVDEPNSDVKDCTAVVDLEEGTLTMPCVTRADDPNITYEVIMEQRGNSMNWEVSFLEQVPDVVEEGVGANETEEGEDNYEEDNEIEDDDHEKKDHGNKGKDNDKRNENSNR